MAILENWLAASRNLVRNISANVNSSPCLLDDRSVADDVDYVSLAVFGKGIDQPEGYDDGEEVRMQ